MSKKLEFLNPKRKLVDEVVQWLCEAERVRMTTVGAHSLAHLMVVVPTAQSERSLRLALAREAAKRGWGGVLPPRVVRPMELVKPAEMTRREATPAEAAAAFQQYVKTHAQDVLELDCLVRKEEFEDLTARFALFDQLQDIWRTLAGRGILMQEVSDLHPKCLENDWADEQRRWEQLGQLEKGYFDYLHGLGLVYPTENVHAAKTQAALVPEEIEEIVLPALADPLRVLKDVLAQQLAAGRNVTVLLHAEQSEADRFDEWGLPKTACWTGASRPNLDGLEERDIVCTANGTALAEVVARDFPSADGAAALPSLALCDETLFQGVASAFLNRGYTVHNPERHRLAQSSLGRLIRSLMALYSEGTLPWTEFRSVLRSDDVMRALALSTRARARVLAGADVVQNVFIPTVLPAGLVFPETDDVMSWQKEDVAAFCATGRTLEAKLAECRAGATLVVYLRRALQWIFGAHELAEGTREREFLAAVSGVQTFLAGLESEVLAALAMTPAEFMALARRELDAAVYSLESDAPDALKTEGWLELAWSAADQVALVGFHEGKVPDSIIGHPFLPDALRADLGLVTNEDRLARDTWILKELLASRTPHAVRAYVARANDAGDLCRPSRLLYLCSDAALATRIAFLFGDLPEERVDRVRRVEWALELPDAVERPQRFSPSRIDTYVKCPFTYLLKYGLGMEPYREKRELEANDFGTLVHAALEEYAKRQIVRGDDQLTDAGEIRRLLLDEILPGLCARYGRTTLNIALQLKAVAGRLAFFADVQARWAREGWRIRWAEQEIDAELADLGFRVHGFIDRVDENINPNAAKRWCLVDYKTWDKKSLSNRVFTSTRASAKREAQLELAHRLGFPLVKNKEGEETQRMLSVQLPIYGRGLSAQKGYAFAEMQFCYLILAASVEETGFCTPLTDDQVTVAVATAKRAVELIGRSIFWPPGPTDDWKWDFAGLFVADPQTDLGATAWVQRQTERLEEEHV